MPMFMVHMCAKFHTPRYNGPLVVVIGRKAKENVRTVAMLLFYILQTHYLNKSYIFRRSLTIHHFVTLD
jgi:hypothetical protein